MCSTFVRLMNAERGRRPIADWRARRGFSAVAIVASIAGRRHERRGVRPIFRPNKLDRRLPSSGRLRALGLRLVTLGSHGLADGRSPRTESLAWRWRLCPRRVATIRLDKSLIGAGHGRFSVRGVQRRRGIEQLPAPKSAPAAAIHYPGRAIGPSDKASSDSWWPWWGVCPDRARLSVHPPATSAAIRMMKVSNQPSAQARQWVPRQYSQASG